MILSACHESLDLPQLGTGSGQRRNNFGCWGEKKGCDAGACSADGVDSQLWQRNRVVSASVFLANLASAGTRSPCFPSLLSAFAQALFILLKCLELNSLSSED